MDKQPYSKMTAPTLVLAFRRVDECLPFSELKMEARDLSVYLTVENGEMQFVIELCEDDFAIGRQRIVLN